MPNKPPHVEVPPGEYLPPPQVPTERDAYIDAAFQMIERKRKQREMARAFAGQMDPMAALADASAPPPPRKLPGYHQQGVYAHDKIGGEWGSSQGNTVFIPYYGDRAGYPVTVDKSFGDTPADFQGVYDMIAEEERLKRQPPLPPPPPPLLPFK